MKKIILLVLVFLLVFSTGCSVLDKLVIFGRAVDFFTAWVAHDQEDIEDALTGEVTYNGLTMLKRTAATDLAREEWWENYITVGDPKYVTELDGGKATVTCEFTIMEKEKPDTEEDILMLLVYTKSDWADWKICSLDINPIWIAP